MKILEGYKSYIAAVGVVCVGIGQFLQGDTSILETATYIFNGLGIAGIRYAVYKNGAGL